MSWFMHHAVLFALLCAGAAVLYGLGLTVWLLRQPAGTERMQEIARAVQEGAAAYLRRQYTTIAAVAIVPFLLLGFYHSLGWGTAIGFLIGATLSAAAGFIGMNVAVRSNVRTAEAARSGLPPALNVAFRAGAVTGLLLGGTRAAATSGKSLFLYPLAIGGVSIIASIVGVQFARVRHGGNIMNALYRAVLVATVFSAAAFVPITLAFRSSGKFSFWNLYGSSLVGLGVTFLLVGITEYYTGTRWNPAKSISKASQTGHAT